MIFLECFNDEAVVRALGVPKRSIEHEPGKSLVAEALRSSQEPTAIGLVDQDPGAATPPYLREFRVVENLTNLGLIRYQHPTDGKFLIEIQPDLEPWLYATAREAGVSPSDHFLPSQYRQLHDQPKAHAAKVMALVADLIARGSQRMLRLQSWLAP